jgi:flagellar protein FlgJ
LGIAPEVLLAQAALETGWGRFVAADQRGSSNNLFNIKAGAGWSGPTVAVQTLEYRNGVAEREQATFRAYASPADSFDDYVKLIAGSPRYQSAREAAADPQAYLRGLQRSGYATDPAYADKVLDILGREDAPWVADGLKSSPSRPLTAEGPTVASSMVQGQTQGLIQGLLQGQGW